MSMNTLYKTLKTKEIIAVTSNKDDADKIVKALEKQIPKQINIKVNEFKADDEDIALIWQQLKLAQKVLDKFELEEIFEEFMD